MDTVQEAQVSNKAINFILSFCNVPCTSSNITMFTLLAGTIALVFLTLDVIYNTSV